VTLPAGSPTVVELLTASGLSESNSAARRTVKEGGAYVNNVKMTDPDAGLPPESLLHGRYALVRRGKRTLAMVEVQPA
jgi:tyrosyl-tRNA synthetase